MANSKTRADRIISRQISHCTVEAAHLSAVGVDVHHDLLVCCFQKLDPIAGELTSNTAASARPSLSSRNSPPGAVCVNLQ